MKTSYLKRIKLPYQSMTNGIHEKFQLSLTGIIIPIAASFPPKIGAIEGASSWRTIVSQIINPLYATASKLFTTGNCEGILPCV
ncbi:MAG: hypothetical protein GY696_28275 [Gammaproteobacteria bacterium]|nr:hypothetical protein [Gammaproteobacteria bacterium]